MQAMIVNLAIIALVAVGVGLTSNPMCILALFFLRDMTPRFDPMAAMMAQMQAMPPEEEDEPNIGFTADVK